MPEGDTIRRLADKITQRFAGERCTRCVTRDPRLVGLDLTGRTLLGADAVGKHLLIRFDDGRTLHAHLRMDGSFDVGPASRQPEWRRRVELWMTNGRLTAVDVPVSRRRTRTRSWAISGPTCAARSCRISPRRSTE
jgi:endonuclease-8